MVYCVAENPEHDYSLRFLNSEAWYDEFSSSTGPDYRMPDEPIIMYLDVEAYTPDAPPSIMGSTYVFFADKKFKSIIEKLEPGIHCFVPFELRYGTPENFKAFPFYFVRPQQNFNPIDIDNSDLKWLQRVTDDSWFWKKKRDAPFTLKRELTKGRHLWSYHVTFISDEIHDEIHQQGLVTAWTFEKQLESTATAHAD